MLQVIEQLLVVQNRDRRIATLRNELRHVPLERRAMEVRLSSANTELDRLKAALAELEVQKKSLQVEAQSRRDQIARFRTQQMQTRKNEEYQALGNEIGHFEKEIEKTEDKELTVMEEIEAFAPRIAQAQATATEARKVVETQLTNLDAKDKTLREQLQSTESERAGLIPVLDEDLLRIYDRLFATKDGNAVVPLEGDVCTGCSMKVTTQTTVRVKAEKEITHCEQCGRILYRSI